MQELKKVLSGHLGQVVFLAGKVTIKAHLHLEQWSQDRRPNPRRRNYLRHKKDTVFVL